MCVKAFGTKEELLSFDPADYDYGADSAPRVDETLGVAGSAGQDGQASQIWKKISAKPIESGDEADDKYVCYTNGLDSGARMWISVCRLFGYDRGGTGSLEIDHMKIIFKAVYRSTRRLLDVQTRRKFKELFVSAEVCSVLFRVAALLYKDGVVDYWIKKTICTETKVSDRINESLLMLFSLV